MPWGKSQLCWRKARILKTTSWCRLSCRCTTVLLGLNLAWSPSTIRISLAPLRFLCTTMAARIHHGTSYSRQTKLESRGRTVILNGHRHPQPKGVGYSRNVAVFQSRGKYLCFQDADDVMMEGRVRLQLDAAIKHPDSIIGCQITRNPEGSTKRYTHWLNNMSQAQLFTQVFTSHGPTVLMATWFCSRALFDRVGKFDERGKGVPEDLLFFYNHLRQGGGVHRVDAPLLCYRYHEDGASRSVQENTIWDLRVNFLEERVLQHWKHFTIWNAGKQGRHLFRSLTPKNQLKVLAFCDVDSKKIVKAFYTYHESKQRPKPTVPVVHFTEARPPFVLCVKMDFTGGYFEQNLASLCLDEEVHYVHFN
uniref:Glycosyltransferase 2-like domain-containing protein n=1 Tax=Eptatretus burgeri TaxID=7764 RepID=A0A8C4QIC8_EPTBU